MSNHRFVLITEIDIADDYGRSDNEVIVELECMVEGQEFTLLGRQATFTKAVALHVGAVAELPDLDAAYETAVDALGQRIDMAESMARAEETP